MGSKILNCYILSLLTVLSILFLWPGDDLLAKIDHARADAVNQLIEKTYVVKPDGSYRMRLHLITKILTYKGKKDWADFKYPYNSSFQRVMIDTAKTTSSTGKVLSVAPNEIQDIQDPSTARSSLFSKARIKVINLPAVEPGSVIEIGLTLVSQKGFWTSESFELTNPTILKRVTVSSPMNLGLVSYIKNPAIVMTERKAGGIRTCVWEGRNLKKHVRERHTPSIMNSRSMLILSSYTNWAQVAGFFKALFDVCSTATSGSDSLGEFNGVDHLYIKMMRDFNVFSISFFDTDLVPQSPAKTIERGYGTPVDLALLFTGILKQRGIKAAMYMLGPPNVFLGRLVQAPSPGYFTTCVVRACGKFFAFNTKELAPGVTGMSGQYALGLESGHLEKIVDAWPGKVTADIDTKIEDTGRMEVRYSSKLWGRLASQRRQVLRYLSPREWPVATSVFLHTLSPLARGPERLHASGLRVPVDPLGIDVDFTVEAGPVYSSGMYFTMLSPSPMISLYSDCLPNRHNPLAILRNGLEVLNLKIHLPSDMEVVSVPAPRVGKVGPLSWRLKCQASDHLISCYREVRLSRSLVEPDNTYREFEKKIAALADPIGRTLVLKKKTSGD